MTQAATISKDELEDFQIGCRNAGVSPDEINLSARDEAPATGGAVRRVITLSRGSQTLDIDAGDDPDWIDKAIDAMKNSPPI